MKHYKNKLIELAESLTDLKYSVLACNNQLPIYSYKSFATDRNKCLDEVKNCNNTNFNCLSIITRNNFIVLDVDTSEQFNQLKIVSNKYQIKSNLVIKTKNGYHAYYAVNYSTSAKNDCNNSIAIKCNNMPITAPNSFRIDKQYQYKVVSKYNIPSKDNLVLIPEEMYLEVRNFNKPESKSYNTAPTFKAPKSHIQYKYYDKEAEYYLSKLDVDHYLFGDMTTWLQVLCACKMLKSDGAYNQCLNWTRQGVYSDISDTNFYKFWMASDTVKNGGAWLNSAIRRK